MRRITGLLKKIKPKSILGFARKGRFNPLNRRNEKSSQSFARPDNAGVMYAQRGPNGEIVSLNGERRAGRTKAVQKAMAKRGVKVGNRVIPLVRTGN